MSLFHISKLTGVLLSTAFLLTPHSNNPIRSPNTHINMTDIQHRVSVGNDGIYKATLLSLNEREWTTWEQPPLIERFVLCKTA